MVKSPATKTRKASTVVGAPSRLKLLQSAEKIIVDEGIVSLSIRRIAHSAGLNSQLISHYFGGITQLTEVLLWDNLNPIIEQRRSMLDDFMRAGKTLTIDDAIELVLRPMWRDAAYTKGVHANVVLSEIMTNGAPSLRSAMMESVKGAYHELAGALSPQFPQISYSSLLWRLCCISGSIVSVVTPRFYTPKFFGPVGEEFSEFTDEEWFKEMYAFTKGALLAPPYDTSR